VNRTDRLYALVEELRAVAPRLRRSAQLAARFEVSVRTIERDLLALQVAGVPIWAQPGPGGGYAVDPAHTLPPVNFTAAEATAIATALATPGATPLPQAARTALQKLVAAMAGPDAVLE
jgi:predicted DNA-binding transcriptional regulator YafY